MTSLEKQVKSSIQERTRATALAPPTTIFTSSNITKDAILGLIGKNSDNINDNRTVQGFINKLAGELATAKAGVGNQLQLNMKDNQIRQRDQEIGKLKSDHKEDLKAIYDALVGLTDGSSSNPREILDNALKKSEGN